MHSNSTRPNFMHLHVTYHGVPKRATVAYVIDGSKLRWGVAICNEEVDKYERAEGRRVSTDALTEKSNSVELHVLRTVAVGVAHHILLARDVGSPFSLTGVLAADEALGKMLDSAEDTFALLSTEFLERCIEHTLEAVSIRSQCIGDLVFDSSHFE